MAVSRGFLLCALGLWFHSNYTYKVLGVCVLCGAERVCVLCGAEQVQTRDGGIGLGVAWQQEQQQHWLHCCHGASLNKQGIRGGTTRVLPPSDANNRQPRPHCRGCNKALMVQPAGPTDV